MKTVAGLFDTYQDAENAINELQNIGITREHVSVMARDAVIRERVVGGADALEENAGAGAIGGTAVGGLGGLLVGISALSVPGIGPVITAGSLATLLGSTAAGAGLGAATGGIIGALVSEGIPEEDAHVYAEGVRRGGILLKVTVDDQLAPEVMNAMERANVVDVAARRDEWQRGGWEYFDESATPSPGDIRYGGIRAV